MFMHHGRQLLKLSRQYLVNKVTFHKHLCLLNEAAKLQNTANQELRGHVYEKSDFVLSLPTDQLSKYLLSQVLYNKDGVVVLNKPYGLASSKQRVSIYDCISSLAEHLGHKELKIVSIPERYTSGLTILAANSQVENALDHCMRRTRCLTPATSKLYLTVTIGSPVIDERVDKFAITKQRKGKRDYELILREWSNEARKRREVNIGFVGFNKVSCTNEASLLSVGTWLYQHHCPRVFLADVLLSPVLGDEKFGVRVGSLFGKKIHIKPWNAPVTKYLPDSVLLPLHLHKGEERLIPLHLHLHEVRLKNLFNRGLDLILRASPPQYFKWTCEQLGLSLPATPPCQLVPIREESEHSQTSDLNNLNK